MYLHKDVFSVSDTVPKDRPSSEDGVRWHLSESNTDTQACIIGNGRVRSQSNRSDLSHLLYI